MTTQQSPLARAVVEATFDDVVWAAAVNDLGADRALAMLKTVHRDIGQQMAQAADRMANTRDSDDVDDTDYRTARSDYRDWHRRATAIRRSIERRIAEVGPIANSVHDRHQADRRVLLRLAKRIWLWEHGLEDHLTSALDDLDCSYGAGARRPLREIVEALAAGSGEVLP